MIPGNRLMQVPPDALDRVGLRRVFRKVVQDDTTAVLGQVVADGLAIVKAGIVADDVDHAVRAQPVAQVLQMGHEQLGVAAPARHRQEQAACSPVERSRQVAFVVVARRGHLGLLAARPWPGITTISSTGRRSSPIAPPATRLCPTNSTAKSPPNAPRLKASPTWMWARL